MELILTKDVTDLGKKGDVVRVRDGFARNFLLPQSLAIAATRANRDFVEEQRVRAEKRKTKEKAEAEEKAGKLSALNVTIAAKAGEQEKLFGAVTAAEIQEELSRLGWPLDKKHIHLKDPIRSLGKHAVSVDVYPGVKANVTVKVVQQS